MSLALRRDIVDRGLTEKWTPLAGQAPQHGAAVPHHLATAGLFPALRGLRGEKEAAVWACAWFRFPAEHC